MTKILLLLFPLFFAFLGMSQSTLRLTVKEYLKDVEYHQIQKFDLIDSTAIFITVQIKENGFYKMRLYYTEIEPVSKQFNTTLLDMTHFEVYKFTGGTTFFKKDKKIYALRTDKNKSEIHYFVDEFKGNKFEITEVPIFKGATSEGYGYIQELEIIDNYIRLYNPVFEMKKSSQYITQLKYTFLNLSDFSFVKSSSFYFTKENLFKLEEMKMYRTEKPMFICRLYDDEIKKYFLKIVLLDGFDFKEVSIKNEKENNRQDAGDLFVMDSAYYCYIINKNIEEWSSIIYKLNFEDQIAIATDELPFKKELFSKENSNKGITKRLYYRTIASTRNNYDLENTENYIISFIENYSEGYEDISGGYTYTDIIISKIENEDIVWNQYIRRSARGPSLHYDSTLVEITEDNILIYDLENEKNINSNGVFDSNIEDPNISNLKKNWRKIKISINRKTGEFKREFID